MSKKIKSGHEVNSLAPSNRILISLIIGAVSFNAFLAFVNAQIFQLNSTIVILAEVAIDAAVLAFVLRRPDRIGVHWFGLIFFILILNLLNSLFSQRFDPKLIRDVLIIPIFILLGLQANRTLLIKITIILQCIVLVFMIFEALRPESFGQFFNILSYYVNTRGFEESSFWAQDQGQSDLFVSATRPGERFLFPSLNIHRLSSIFLEPVSLGNYCVIVVLITISLWDVLETKKRVFLVISSGLILIGCDGRFATASIFLLLILKVAAPLLPRYFNIAYLPGVLIIAAFAVSIFGLTPGGDDFPTRTAGSIYDLAQMNLATLFGFETESAYSVMDSGIAYLLYSQSLVGAIVIWTLIALGLKQKDKASIMYSHGTSAYVALNLLISYSMFSIKTASLLWFAFGAMSQFKQAVSPPVRSAQAALRRGLVTAGSRRSQG